MNQVKQEMLALLLEIQVNGPKRPNKGICSQHGSPVLYNTLVLGKGLEEFFCTWPLYSGSEVFPVPHPTLNAERAYLDTNGNLWDRDTEYGRNRWSLLEHCITELRAQLCVTS
jgi:hypothetical protein